MSPHEPGPLQSGAPHHRVLLLLSTERDATLTAELLGQNAIESHACRDAAELQREMARGAGAVLVAEETLGPAGAQNVLAQAVQTQPRWSDLPLLLLTSGGADSTAVGDAVATLSNVTLLERPLRVASLISAVRTALRARKRQYEIQAHLRDLEQARDAEAMAVHRKDEFLAMLAHELRNPLAPISNALHVMRISEGDQARRSELREMMQRQVTHMVRLVDDLLEASRLSRGMITLHPERLELCNALRGAVELSRPLIDRAHQELELDLPDCPLPVTADPVRIAQVFGNLLNNASKYGRHGGRIRVTARAQGDMVVVAVSDDGVGIEADMLPRVFELFTQGPRDTGALQEGLGIGLALVRNLVGLHGGSVEARSDGKGQGSRFEVRLPLAVATSAAAPLRAPTAAAGAARRDGAGDLRVLVVDDNHDAARSLAMVLKAMGLDPRVCHGGEDALRIAREYQPQLILLDVGMPVMDGYEVARQIRGSSAFGHPMLVAVTGWSHVQDRQRSEAAGFDLHFPKPADIPSLTALVNALRAGAEVGAEVGPEVGLVDDARAPPRRAQA